LQLALQDSTLESGSDRNHLIGVYLGRGLFPEYLFHVALDRRSSCLPSDKNHFVDVVGAQLGVFYGSFAVRRCTFHETQHQLFKLDTREDLVEMLRTLGIRSNEGKVYMGFDGEGELALGF